MHLCVFLPWCGLLDTGCLILHSGLGWITEGEGEGALTLLNKKDNHLKINDTIWFIRGFNSLSIIYLCLLFYKIFKISEFSIHPALQPNEVKYSWFSKYLHHTLHIHAHSTQNCCFMFIDLEYPATVMAPNVTGAHSRYHHSPFPSDPDLEVHL